MSQFSLNFLPERKVYSVSEITAAIRDTLEGEFAEVWVEGEVSNCRRAPSGHTYFTLKDAEAQLRCVWFRQNARFAKFQVEDGLAVLARGRIGVYEARGEYQLLVETVEPRGAGALQLAFEQLKKKLAADGLFDAARKKPLPVFPRRIGLVTSPRGAVIADMLHILERRFAGLRIQLYPVRVQGEGAAGDICEALDYFSSRRGREKPDLIILGRGGGSLEDLWPFNEEKVARAIAASSVPVISAVGHETDFTIADFVADLRAPTPSAAAELAVRTRAEWVAEVGIWEERIGRAARYRLMLAAKRLTELGIERPAALLRRRLAQASQRTDELDYQLRERLRRRLLESERRLREADRRLRAHDPRRLLAEWGKRLAAARAALEHAIAIKLGRVRSRAESLGAQLGHLSPLAVLERGYAIVENEQGRLVRRAAEAAVGERVRVRLHEGRLRARVEQIEAQGTEGGKKG